MQEWSLPFSSSGNVGQWERRHRAMAETNNKRTSRGLGAEQKPTRPASEVVREPLPHRGGDPRTPASSTGERVVAATAVRGQDRRILGSPHSSRPVSVSRLWPRGASIPASSRLRAVGVTAPPRHYDGFGAMLARSQSSHVMASRVLTLAAAAKRPAPWFALSGEQEAEGR